MYNNLWEFRFLKIRKFSDFQICIFYPITRIFQFSDFRTRLRAADNRLTAAAAASIALRASENSPLTRSSKLVDSTSPGSGGGLLLIEQQKQQDVSYCFKFFF